MSGSNRKQLFVAALLSVAPLIAGSTCADAYNEPLDLDSCVVDAECADATVCFRGVCEPTCESDDECGSGTCSSQARSEMDDVVEICVDELDSEVEAQCRFDTDCEASFPGTEARCGIDGVCFIPAFSMLIRDTTVAPTDTDGGFGADIVAVYLEDPETGTPVAWADTIESSEGGSNEPDGQPRELAGDPACSPAEFSDATTSLNGDGGYLLVRFLEVDPRVEGQVVPTPPSTWNVVVVEWGDNCGADGEQDSYDVYACAAPTHKSTDPDRHCSDRLDSAPTGGVLRIAGQQK